MCKLHSRCHVIAAANTAESYDEDEPLCANLPIPSSLLSRFDIVLVLKDTNNLEWDK